MPHDNKKFKTESGAAVTLFSKNLMGLKFMQNAKAKLEKPTETEPALCDLTNPGYQYCERLKMGRMSFKGMNTRIEALQESLSNQDVSFNSNSGQLTDNSSEEIDDD